MKVTRDVINDLLPLYEAGEATPDTRALVDAFLRDDPEFARKVADGRRYGELLRDSRAAPPAAALEVRTLESTRRLLRWRSWVMGLAIFCSWLPFTFVHVDGRMRFLMWRDAPEMSVAAGVAAVILWSAYARLQFRLRRTAL